MSVARQYGYQADRSSDNAHIVNVSPPLNLAPAWVAEFASIQIAVNSVWPATTIASTGMTVAMGEDVVRAQARSPQIMADALHALVTRPAAECTGRFCTDEEVLTQEGVESVDGYRLAAHEDDLMPNFYLPDVPLPNLLQNR